MGFRSLLPCNCVPGLEEEGWKGLAALLSCSVLMLPEGQVEHNW